MWVGGVMSPGTRMIAMMLVQNGQVLLCFEGRANRIFCKLYVEHERETFIMDLNFWPE